MSLGCLQHICDECLNTHYLPGGGGMVVSGSIQIGNSPKSTLSASIPTRRIAN